MWTRQDRGETVVGLTETTVCKCVLDDAMETACVSSERAKANRETPTQGRPTNGVSPALSQSASDRVTTHRRLQRNFLQSANVARSKNWLFSHLDKH